MNRRAFIGTVTALLTASAAAQEAQKPRRIGILAGSTAPKSGFAAEMAVVGLVEGRNLIIERRSAEGNAQRARVLAEELVRLNVEVIVTFGAVGSLAVRDATHTIPIVSRTGDPVVLGLAASLS